MIQSSRGMRTSYRREPIMLILIVSVAMPHIYLTLANVCIVGFCLIDEIILVRTPSMESGTRTQSFREAVRSRDSECVISGRPVESDGGISDYTGFQAAHIYPLAYKRHWIDADLGRWITDESTQGDTINNVQNGLLLFGGIHALFHTYSLSIDPDVCIFCFYQVLGLTVI